MPMPSHDERLTAVERKLAELEGAHGFLLPQVRQFHFELLAFREEAKGEFAQIKRQMAQLDAKIDAKFDFLDSKFTNLFKSLDEKVDALPRVITELLQEELRKAKQ